MSTYFVTFRIAEKTIDGMTYNDRRQSLVNMAHSNNGYWEETTSFIITTSDLDTTCFAQDISSGLSEAYDLLVAFDPEDMSMAYFGAVKRPDILASFFATAKKLP